MPAPRAPALLVLLLSAALLLASCGSSGGDTAPAGPSITTCGGAFGPCGGGTGPVITIQGRILYERLLYTTSGLGPGSETRPARHIDVEVRSVGGGTCFGRASTDANGDYALLVTPDAGTQIEVAVFSRTSVSAAHDLTVHEADPPSFNVHSQNDVFCAASTAFTAQSRTVDLTVPYGNDPVRRPSIGFGLIDTLVGQVDGVQAALGRNLPALHAYTRIGNNASIFNTSYYSHGLQSIAILGGAAGLPDTTDTDYFDEAIVAHEFHHFVDRSISHSWSRGGAHGGQPLEPAFAWSEGLSTGFGQLMLGSRFYVDTSGTNSAFPASVLFSLDVENALLYDNNGIGDEFTMAEILWDLADDSTPAGDADADGVNVPVADLYAAIDTFDPATDGPYVGLFLQRLVAASAAIDTAGMASFLDGSTGPEDQMISFPPTGSDVFPTPITVGGMHSSSVSSIPVGLGTPNPCRQLASSHWYHLNLAAAATVAIQLSITPTGGSGDDLDLFLHTNQDAFTAIAESTSGGASETINISLPAGTYIIRVEADCGSNNAASYTLTVN
ncbi:MAG: pre-peptidase C-terminal domain-containing protein [Planctomycetota bacterium]|nr:pre-peptidase C-terminal domain-containing protein [Planctomycetota bacterium]